MMIEDSTQVLHPNELTPNENKVPSNNSENFALDPFADRICKDLEQLLNVQSKFSKDLETNDRQIFDDSKLAEFSQRLKRLKERSKSGTCFYPQQLPPLRQQAKQVPMMALKKPSISNDNDKKQSNEDTPRSNRSPRECSPRLKKKAKKFDDVNQVSYDFLFPSNLSIEHYDENDTDYAILHGRNLAFSAVFMILAGFLYFPMVLDILFSMSFLYEMLSGCKKHFLEEYSRWSVLFAREFLKSIRELLVEGAGVSLDTMNEIEEFCLLFLQNAMVLLEHVQEIVNTAIMDVNKIIFSYLLSEKHYYARLWKREDFDEDEIGSTVLGDIDITKVDSDRLLELMLLESSNEVAFNSDQKEDASYELSNTASTSDDMEENLSHNAHIDINSEISDNSLNDVVFSDLTKEIQGDIDEIGASTLETVEVDTRSFETIETIETIATIDNSSDLVGEQDGNDSLNIAEKDNSSLERVENIGFDNNWEEIDDENVVVYPNSQTYPTEFDNNSFLDGLEEMVEVAVEIHGNIMEEDVASFGDDSEELENQHESTISTDEDRIPSQFEDNFSNILNDDIEYLTQDEIIENSDNSLHSLDDDDSNVISPKDDDNIVDFENDSTVDQSCPVDENKDGALSASDSISDSKKDQFSSSSVSVDSNFVSDVVESGLMIENGNDLITSQPPVSWDDLGSLMVDNSGVLLGSDISSSTSNQIDILCSVDDGIDNIQRNILISSSNSDRSPFIPTPSSSNERIFVPISSNNEFSTQVPINSTLIVLILIFSYLGYLLSRKRKFSTAQDPEFNEDILDEDFDYRSKTNVAFQSPLVRTFHR